MTGLIGSEDAHRCIVALLRARDKPVRDQQRAQTMFAAEIVEILTCVVRRSYRSVIGGVHAFD